METPKQQLNSCPCRMTSHLRDVSRCSNPSVGWVVGPSGSRSPASAAGSCPRPVDAVRGRASPAGARSRARERARHGRRGIQPGLWPGASDPVLRNGHAHKGSVRSARTGICGPHAPAGLKPIADELRSMLPFGSPKRGGQHEQTRRNTGGDARSQVDPPHGGTGVGAPRQGRWRDQSPLWLRRYMGGPAWLATIPPLAALREARLNGFPEPRVVVPCHRNVGRRRPVSDTSPTGSLGAAFGVKYPCQADAVFSGRYRSRGFSSAASVAASTFPRCDHP